MFYKYTDLLHILKLVNVFYINFLVLSSQRIYNYYYHAITKTYLRKEVDSLFFKNNAFFSWQLKWYYKYLKSNKWWFFKTIIRGSIINCINENVFFFSSCVISNCSIYVNFTDVNALYLAQFNRNSIMWKPALI